MILYHGHNQWTFPRGKIEGEERSFAAALRETREETGLSRTDIRFVDYFKAYENWTFVKNGEKIHKTIIFYLAETSKKNIRVEHNFDGYCWFPYREAVRVFVGPKNNENRKVLKQAYDFLTGKNKGGAEAALTPDARPTHRPMHPPRPRRQRRFVPRKHETPRHPQILVHDPVVESEKDKEGI